MAERVNTKPISGIARRCYIGLGFITFGLGVVGIFVPLLPTTPFLLVAIFAFSRSMPSMTAKILRNKYLAPYVTSYVSGSGFTGRQKFRTLALMWVVMLSSIIFATDIIYVRIALLVIGLGVTIHILTYKGRHFSDK